MTVGGLRANIIWDVSGVIVGEPVTVSRDLAKPTVPADVLSAWASEQAELIRNEQLEDEVKARAAEVVLECGGEIGDLPIVRWGGEWLNSKELSERINTEHLIYVNFEGDYSYDEDWDDMHPKEFAADFSESEEIINVPEQNGSIIHDRGIEWPAILLKRQNARNNLSDRVRQVIREAWSEEVDESSDEHVVGTAGGHNVIREVTTFHRPPVDDV